MTKEEKIKEAYGISYTHNKDVIDENGWNQKRIFCQSDLDHDNFDYDGVGHGVYISRPKSLQGIENNNGWIKLTGIKNEIPFGSGCVELYSMETEEYYISTDDNEFIEIGRFTHYKIFNKSELPIF